MLIQGKHYQTIWLNEKDSTFFSVIDQRSLPHELKIMDIKSVNETAFAIKEMVVRGAPLIGVTAAFGLYLATLEADQIKTILMRFLIKNFKNWQLQDQPQLICYGL